MPAFSAEARQGKGDDVKSLFRFGPISTLAHLLFVAVVFFVFALQALSPSVLPSQDSAFFHYPYFKYFSNSLALGFGFPLWDPAYGGIPVGASSISMSPLLPYKLIGYFLYTVLPLDPATIYKATVMLGMFISAAGWWLFLRRFTGARTGATFGTLMILMGGTAVTALHQEQVVFTITWAPWILFFLSRVKERFINIIPAAALTGATLSVHYPQIHIMSYLFLVPALVAAGAFSRDFIDAAWRQRKTVLLAAAFLVTAAAPVFYVYAVKDGFSSPIREAEEMGAKSYEDYIKLNTMQSSSASPAYFKNYFWSEKGAEIDSAAFYVTKTGLLLVVLGAALRFRKAIPVLIMLALSAWASLGINGGLPQLLYTIKFPFIGYFRQWYHFVPLVNLCLAALGGLGISAVLSFFQRPSFEQNGRFLSCALLAALFATIFLEGSLYFKNYIGEHLNKASGPVASKTAGDEFIAGLSVPAEKETPLLIYKNVNEMITSCPQVPGRPFATALVYNDASVPQGLRANSIRAFCDKGLSSSAVLASIPGPIDGPSPDIVVVSGDYALLQAGSTEIRFFEKGSFQVTPQQAALRGANPSASFIVLPFSDKFRLLATLNGRPVDTYPVFNGGLIGVIVPEGPFELELSMPFSWYYLAVLIQYAALAAALLSLLLLRKRGTH